MRKLQHEKYVFECKLKMAYHQGSRIWKKLSM